MAHFLQELVIVEGSVVLLEQPKEFLYRYVENSCTDQLEIFDKRVRIHNLDHFLIGGELFLWLLHFEEGIFGLMSIVLRLLGGSLD